MNSSEFVYLKILSNILIMQMKLKEIVQFFNMVFL